MGRASSRGDDDTDDSVSGEGSLRLNPAVVRKRGMKLTGASPETSMGVIDISGKVSGKGIARPDNSSLRLEVGAAEESDRGLFGGMLNGAEAGCESFCSCLPLANALGVRSRSRTSDATEASAIELEPLSRDASQYTREKNKMPPKRTTWWQVTLYIINDVIGAFLILYSSVILGMYGWVLGLLILILMWPLNLYTAHLLWRCRNAFPGAISIGDLVFYVTRSSVAMYAAFFFANLCILITLSNQVFTAASNIYYFFDRTYPELYGGMCFAGVSAIVVAILVPLTQIRYLHQLTPINILNVTCMLIFMVLAVYSLVLRGDVSPDHMVGPNTDALSMTWTNPGSLQASGPVLGFQVLFNGYYYQVLILEMMGEMKDPAEFPKANYWSTPVILGVTLTMAITQYYYLGGRQEIVDVTPVSVLESFFGTSNRRNPVAIAAIACFSVHMIGCCVIRSVVLTRSCLLLIAPKRANESNWGSRLAWTAISLVVLAVAWGLSTVIVTIAFTAWITTMLVIVVTFFIPIACYLVICKKRKALGRIPKLEVALLAFIVLFCLFVIVTEVVKEAIEPRIFVEIQNRTLLEIEAAYQCTDFQF